MSEHLDALENMNALDELDAAEVQEYVPVLEDDGEQIPVEVLDIGKRKRRLARILGGMMPIPLSPDADALCDQLASKRVLEGMERERREMRREFQFSWNLKAKKQAMK